MPRLSEDGLIATYLAPLAGPGGLGLRDDAGLATPKPGHDLVVTKDMLVAGVHFFADDPPGAIARKALRVNLSDLAAKGAVPLGFMLGLGLPGDWTEAWLHAFAAGLADDAKTYACPLIGGDTVAMPSTAAMPSTKGPGPLTLSITAFGEVPSGRMVPRTGTRAGDLIYVTGTIGDAALGLLLNWQRSEHEHWIAALDPVETKYLRDRYLQPSPRLMLREALQAHAHSAMDVSDGFVGDLAKMLRLEGLATTITSSRVPLSAAARQAVRCEPSLLRTVLTGGDDYEIVCGVPADQAAAFERKAAAADIVVTIVGTAVQGEAPIQIFDHENRLLDLSRPSFQHFSDLPLADAKP